MLSKEKNVQVSDTTELKEAEKVGRKKKIT